MSVSIKKIKKYFFVPLMTVLVFFSSFPLTPFLQDLARNKIIDKLYLSSLANKVVDNFGAGTAEAALSGSTSQYLINIGPINGSTSSGYVYATIMNPTGSGKTLSVSRLRIATDAVAAATFQSLTVRRISSSTGGTLIATSDIPKKNSDSTDSVALIRHTGVTATYSYTANSRLTTIVGAGAVGVSDSVSDQSFQDAENIILQPGEGLAYYQEAAGSANQRVKMYLEWTELGSAPASQGEYMLNYPRVEVAATAGYGYASFFNPVGSGKTAVVKRISIDVTCDAAAVYTNNIGITRITSATGGTQITSSEAPKKNTTTPDSVMEFRHTGVTLGFAQATSTATSTGFTTISPCGAASQPNGHKTVRLFGNDEKIILQPGEGIGLYSGTAGNINHITRLSLEWGEQASTPAAQGEYMFNYPRVELAAAANGKYATFFNPAGSGKYAVIKRLGIRADADSGATYQAISVRRISAASGASLIAAGDVLKKNTGSADSAMQLRYNNVTATLTGSGVDSRIAGVTGDAAVGQIIANKDIVFGDREPLIIKPGEGIALYSEATGDIDQYIRLQVEWKEQASEPATQNEYMTSIGQISGSATSDYVYASFYNAPTSTVTAVVKRVGIRVDSAATATSIPFSIMRISTTSGGTLIAASDIPKKNSSSTNSSMIIRRTGVTVSYSGSLERLLGVTSPSTVAAAASPALSGQSEKIYTYSSTTSEESLILKPGEGIALRQEGGGYTGHRIFMDVEWQEVANASAPAAQNGYIYSSQQMVGSTAVNYVYGSLYNPVSSGKNLVVQRMETRVQATTTATYIAINFRRISTSTGGTLVTAANLAPKNSSSGTATAEVRNTGPTVTYTSPTTSRLSVVITPGAVNQINGIQELQITTNDEFILKPGEGIAMQMEAAGDTDQKVFFAVQWYEQTPSTPTISVSGTVYDTDESTGLSSGLGLIMAVGPSAPYYATTTSGGVFSFTGVATISTSTVITIYLNTGGATQGSLVFKYGSGCTGGDCSGLSLVKNAVVIDNEDTGSITNSDLAACDNDSGSACSDADIGFTSNSGSLNVTFSGDKLKIASGVTFAPGGNVTTQKLHIAGTYSAGTEILALTGSGTNSTCASGTLMPMCVTGTFNASTSTVSFRGTATTSVPSLNYYNLDFSPASGSPNYVLGSVTYNSWYNTGWGYRKAITIDHNKVASSTSETYANFPVLISMTDADLKYTGSSGYVASSTGADILFTSSDGTTKLNHELEKYSSSTGETIAWVKLPSLSTSTDTTLYMYFGNSSSTLASQASSTAVWDSNYKAVYHLPNGTTLSGNDSTSNANHGTLNSVTVTSGQIDGAASFAGTDASNISKATNASLNTSGSFTMEAWINANSYSVYHDVITKTNTFASSGNYYFETTAAGELDCGFWNGSNFIGHISSGAGLTASNWYHISCVFDEPNNTVKIYRNGTQVLNTAENSAPQSDSGDSLYIGGGYATEGFPGKIDEVRISLATRTADWIKTSYNNQSSTTTFYSVGALDHPVATDLNISGDLTTGGAGNPVVDVNTNDPDLNIYGSLSIASGDSFLASNSATTTVDHNFANSGTFTHNNGTVVFGTSTQTSVLSSTATTTFYNFVVTTPGKTIKFQKATANVPVFTFANNFVITGSNGNLITIQSDTASSAWMANFVNAQSSISYAYIKDSGCYATSANATVSNGGNGGNNSSCWLGLPALIIIDRSGGGSGTGGGSGGGAVYGGGGAGGSGGTGGGGVDGSGAPTFVQEAETDWSVASQTVNPKTTSSFNVQAGDVLVAYGVIENVSNLDSISVSGGSLVWTPQQTVNINSFTYLAVWTATVDSNKSMTVNFTCSNDCVSHNYRFGGDVLTFRNSGGVGGSNSTNSLNTGSGSTLNLTTTQNNSVIVTVVGDWDATDGSSRVWRTVNSITPTSGNGLETTYNFISLGYTVYGAYYSNAGTAGSKTVGLSAPVNQKYSIAAVEIKASNGSGGGTPTGGGGSGGGGGGAAP